MVKVKRVAAQQQPKHDSCPLRPPLPTVEDIRSCIPPQGITPAKLAKTFGNLVIGRQLFENPQRRSQFWALVSSNSRRTWTRSGRKILLPLYNGAYLGSPIGPPLPPPDDIRARIPPHGITRPNFVASLGDLTSGDPAGLYPDDMRYYALEAAVERCVIHDQVTDILKVWFPDNDELLAVVGHKGISPQNILKVFWFLATPGMFARFRALVQKNTIYIPEPTNLLMPRGSSTTAGQSTLAAQARL